MNIQQTLQNSIAQGLDRLDAQLLLLHVLGKAPHDRAWLLAHDADPLPEAAHFALLAATERRLNGEPVAYIVGHKEFYGLQLAVDRRVLVPRPDTETLVDWALEVLPAPAEAVVPRVIDLGTGSGAIALALKHTRPDLDVHAVDYSDDALAVAQANAHHLKLGVHFGQGSWLSGITPAHGQFHAIVSNPPYIAAQDAHLAALTHEPPQALASGTDGLDDVRTIITQAPAKLLPGGWLLLEHGYDQADAVCALLSAAGFTTVQSRRDLAGIARCSGGCWTGPHSSQFKTK
jgi:release factor glutamine methyltransferase